MKVPWAGGEWNRVLVYGLGLSGMAAARLLRRRGAEVVGVDRRHAEELELGELCRDPGVELRLGAEPQELEAGIDGVVLSPGVPFERPLVRAARQQGVPVIAEVELAFPFLGGPVVGITGSNGKSTTTALTGALLRASGLEVEVCGNIGEPLSARVEGAGGRCFVVELSSFQLEAISTFRCRGAAMLNMSSDHLDRHPTMQAYAAAKSRLFVNQRPEDLAVLNADDPVVAAVATGARRRFFSRLRRVQDGCHLEGEEVVEVAPGQEWRTLFQRSELSLAGQHNLENAMAAVLLALGAGAGAGNVASVLAGFRGLPHRMQRLAEVGGVAYWDDSKATNPAATCRSLEGFADHSVHLILGGRSKATALEDLPLLAARKARQVYLIGEAAERFATSLSGLSVRRCGELGRAVAEAAKEARPGEVVLLAPACASFDQYRSFAERGEHFRCLVEALAGGNVGEEAGL